jgi:hypothetical protein
LWRILLDISKYNTIGLRVVFDTPEIFFEIDIDRAFCHLCRLG